MNAVRFVLFFPFLFVVALVVAVKSIATADAAQAAGLWAWFAVLDATGCSGDGSFAGLFLSPQSTPEWAAAIHQKALLAKSYLWATADWRFFLAAAVAVAVAAGVAGVAVTLIAMRDGQKAEGVQP